MESLINNYISQRSILVRRIINKIKEPVSQIRYCSQVALNSTSKGAYQIKSSKRIKNILFSYTYTRRFPYTSAALLNQSKLTSISIKVLDSIKIPKPLKDSLLKCHAIKSLKSISLELSASFKFTTENDQDLADIILKLKD